MWPALSAAGVRTATTCDVNLNRTDTPPLALTRFLDFHDMPEIVFEAELCGLGSLLRAALRR